MAESKPEPEISMEALNKLREDAGYIPKKKDYEAMQRLLRWAMTPPDPYYSADEILENLIDENPVFIAMLWYMTVEGVKQFLPPSRQAVWVKAIQDEKAFHEMSRMRDMGNPIELAEI